MDKPDCSRHSKQVGGISDMKILAEAIGDLHYETLAELFNYLASKLASDAINDAKAERYALSGELNCASKHIDMVFHHIDAAWKISKPYMDKTTEP